MTRIEFNRSESGEGLLGMTKLAFTTKIYQCCDVLEHFIVVGINPEHKEIELLWRKKNKAEKFNEITFNSSPFNTSLRIYNLFRDFMNSVGILDNVY